jgi:alkanesulfonate monooxygenase SsuD/methylene tetrahydromethanopterin reductase-like flavin-dependent oxidoreductase (luciferase family)
LQAEIMQFREKLQESESRVAGLQGKLDEYLSKERQIAEVMIMAQISAQKTEAQARAKVEILLQDTEEELRRKAQELEMLRIKVKLFKKDIHDRLDQYKTSLEEIMDPSDDVLFVPTLVGKDEKSSQKLIG